MKNVIKDPSEDTVDMVMREYLESKGWKTSYYSPPCGSWSILKIEINNFEYRSFLSERY